MFGPDLKDPAILRDLFAALVAGAIEIGSRAHVNVLGFDTPQVISPDPLYVARLSYKIADAMIEERSKPK